MKRAPIPRADRSDITVLDRRTAITRVGPAGRVTDHDSVAEEEPLEVRLNGESFAVIMRTPGRDLDLAAGFLVAEGVVREPAHIATIRYCTADEDPDLRNVLDVTLSGVDPRRVLDERRRVAMTASCGLCGRTTIESLDVLGRPVDPDWTVAASIISTLPERLRAAQVGFDATGGLHAAGLFDGAGTLEELAEDVGRHNAVDKVIGRRFLRERFPIPDRLLFVSGRASFEIVQKAWLAGLACVCAVSAPSTLAVDLALSAGITLVGFVRGGSFNIYSHPERIT